jgi:hypothetical protein
MSTATPPEPSDQALALEQIRTELAEIREVLNTFTSDGWPLRSQMPSAEFMASMAASIVVLLRDRPLSDADLESRVMAAQVISRLLIKMHDQFNADTKLQQLNNLVP